MDDSKELHWEPLVSVGSFKFDELIQKYIDQYDLRFTDAADELLNWDSYSTPDKNVYIDTEDSRIVAISCYEHFFYKEKNLIGLSLNEIRTLLGHESEIGEQIGEAIPVEYDALSLQLWLKEGYVTNVTCNGFLGD